MRMSCNGCRVLRKGCSENCSIRPCLQWIKNPESQANATVFLAKFYGRAGLMNLISSGPEHHRPAIFRSLLYEACGRIVNPIHGSVGLLWSGSWQLCQAAVEAVLKGAPIVQIPSEAAASPSPPLKDYDIRHVSKDGNSVSQPLHKVKTRSRFKRTAKPNPKLALPDDTDHEALKPIPESSPVCNLRWRRCYPDESELVMSPNSSTTQQSDQNAEDSREAESMFSVETVEASLANRVDPERPGQPEGGVDESELGLELTLGFEPVSHASRVQVASHVMKRDTEGCDGDTCKVVLGLDLST